MALININAYIFSGVIVPGGFGQRGTEGMLLAITYARERRIPFLGVCLGFQLAVIEWARYKLGMKSSSYQREFLLCHTFLIFLLCLRYRCDL